MKLRMTCGLISFLFIIMASPATAQLTDFTMTSEIDSTLKNGGIFTEVWRDKSRKDAAIDVFGAIDIAATPTTIWNIMLDCTRGIEIVADMTSCEVLESSEDALWDIRQQVFKVGFLLPKVTTRFRSDYIENKEIKVSRVGGDMKVQDGLWTLMPLSETVTRVTYRAAVLPKFPVPRGLLKKATRKDTPEILESLRLTAVKDMSENR